MEVGAGNTSLLLDEVGVAECRESGGGGGEGEIGDQRGGEMGGEGETCQLALDMVEQLLVRVTLSTVELSHSIHICMSSVYYYVRRKVRIRTILGFSCANLGPYVALQSVCRAESASFAPRGSLA